MQKQIEYVFYEKKNIFFQFFVHFNQNIQFYFKHQFFNDFRFTITSEKQLKQYFLLSQIMLNKTLTVIKTYKVTPGL